MNVMNIESSRRMKNTVMGEQEKINQDIGIKEEEPLSGNTNQDRIKKMSETSREGSGNKNNGNMVNKSMRGSDKATINERIDEEYKCLNCQKVMTDQERTVSLINSCIILLRIRNLRYVQSVSKI